MDTFFSCFWMQKQTEDNLIGRYFFLFSNGRERHRSAHKLIIYFFRRVTCFQFSSSVRCVFPFLFFFCFLKLTKWPLPIQDCIICMYVNAAKCHFFVSIFCLSIEIERSHNRLRIWICWSETNKQQSEFAAMTL